MMAVYTVRLGACAVFWASACVFAGGPQYDTARVTMSGDIIDTPCTIDPVSRDQTIDMGAVTVDRVARDGHGNTVPFHIRLLDCSLERDDRSLPDWQQFTVTFDGEASGGNFAVRGEGRGVALQIADNSGHIARPGQALPFVTLNRGGQTLDYTLKLVASHRPLQAGTYSAVIHFRLNYF